MQFEKGMVVRSKKGHDKGKFFVIAGLDGGTALLIDSAGRTAQAPKRKNLVHLAPTKTVLDEKTLESDGEIRKILAAFNGRVALPKEVM